jgi:hypothetical protein
MQAREQSEVDPPPSKMTKDEGAERFVLSFLS